MYRILLLLFITKIGFGQTNISGTIYDGETNETLIGANIIIKDGKFTILTNKDLPIEIIISYLGYEDKSITIEDDIDLQIKLFPNTKKLKEVKVVDNRITQKQKEAALTIEALDIMAIKSTPSANFYDALGSLKGVDISSASLGFKVINTRGFNSTSPVRSLQIIDGVDNQAPGLNFSLGNFLGASELDIMKVEIIQGASSAYYGPSAFNGVISMKTRSPFLQPGLTVQYKFGTRRLFENSFRFADVIKDKEGNNKFGYKINFSYMQAYDWEANNLASVDGSGTSSSNPGGYDAVNRYGDEDTDGNLNDPTGNINENYFNFPGLGKIYRTGYMESDLVDYNTKNLKFATAMHYLIEDDLEIIYALNYGTGTTVYQGDNRFSLNGIKFLQNRFEINKKDKFFIRAYRSQEDAGESYDAVFTAIKLQELNLTSNQDWYTYYKNRFRENFNWSSIGWETPTYNWVDTTWLFQGEPIGSSLDIWTSALNHIHSEYQFKQELTHFKIGANFRQYRPDSKGSIFMDTASTIINNEFGFYAGAEIKFLGEFLKLNTTLRGDKNENFDLNFSPAASIVYKPNKQDVIRFSFGSALRNPTLSDQYLYYNVGRAILIGNLNGHGTNYGENLVSIESLLAYYTPAFPNKDSLQFFNVDPIKPEKVQSIELGYRSTFANKIYLDANVYYSQYTDFIGYKIGAKFQTVVDDPLTGGYEISLPSIQAYRIATNAENKVTTKGASIGVNYYPNGNLSLNGNYSWNSLNQKGTNDPIIPAYNTPEHKFNLGCLMKNIHFSREQSLLRDYSFSINYKWVDSYKYEGSPQFTGLIPSYDLLDLQISKEIIEMNATIKLGTTNLLNNLHFEVYGGPYIGRMTYCSILFNIN